MDGLMRSYNIDTTIVGDRYISTACWPVLIEAANGYVKTWETFIWELDENKQRNGLVKQYFHNSETGAIKFHNRFCHILKLRSGSRTTYETDR